MGQKRRGQQGFEIECIWPGFLTLKGDPLKFLGALILSLCFPVAALAADFSPFYTQFGLVAGSSEPGFQDGAFLKASFKGPSGLALSKDGLTLYVCDSGNNAIRTVDLAHQNKVSTLCGGKAGDSVGAFENSSFTNPGGMQLSDDGGKLYVLDQGNGRIKCLDLKTRVSSVVFECPQDGLKHDLTSMALDTAHHCLYTSDASAQCLYRGDLTGGAAEKLGGESLYSDLRGKLILAGQRLFYYRCYDGKFCRVRSAGGDFPGPSDPVDLTATAHLEAGIQLPAQCGFSQGLPSKDGGGTLEFWDPEQGCFRLMAAETLAPNSQILNNVKGLGLGGPTDDDGPKDENFRMLQGPLEMAPDPSHGLIYVAEANSNRILRVDANRLFGNHQPLDELKVGSKGPSTYRILLVGDSLSYFTFPTPDQPDNAHLSFPRQLEMYLNLFSALQGRGIHYEVLCQVAVLGTMGGGVSAYFRCELGWLKSEQIDEVLLGLDAGSIMNEATGFTRTSVEDDLALPKVDYTWFALSPAERQKQYGPLQRALRDEVAAHPNDFLNLLTVENGELKIHSDYDGLMANPRILKYFGDVLEKSLAKDRALAEGQGCRLSAAWIPMRQYFSLAEGQKYRYETTAPDRAGELLGAGARRQGVDWFNLTDFTRLIAAPFYPLIAPNDSHYRYDAQGWLAFYLAQEMLKRDQAQ